ncbi:MAG: NADH-quinone oxidoreductase subunit NuoN [Zoogloeaceae bacterium]|jgi:NADH-quinone oxidoreductase subunit N|nr:NADH-quinone oxidoreductase subunit NuoN [Zoogloeaceae bacterium]
MFASFLLPNLWLAAPEIFLTVLALAVLFFGIHSEKTPVSPARRALLFALAQCALIGCAFWILLESDGQRALTFSNMFLHDLLADFLKLLICATMSVIFVYSRRHLAERDIPPGEFLFLALLSTLGMLVIVSANHFLPLYLGLEMLSLSSCALIALDRRRAEATEAAMKYFALGALASGFLLYGLSLLYGVSGTLEISGVAMEISAKAYTEGLDRLPLVFGLVFVVAGLAFKLGAAPFHMWLPDVYHGAPTPATLILAAAPKIAAFSMTLRLLLGGFFPLAADWQQMLMVLAVISMGIGNFVAIAQENVKRMLAYSAIAHMGFMLLGLCVGIPENETLGARQIAVSAYSASMFYVLTYVLSTVGAFGVMLLLSRKGFEADRLSDYAGLNQRSPWLAALMMIFMLSMAGLPFFVGFFAKFAVLGTVVYAGHYGLAGAAVAFSLLGAFYYLRVIKYMYFDAAPEGASPAGLGATPWGMKTLLTLNALAVALLGIFPHALLAVCLTVLDVSF